MSNKHKQTQDSIECIIEEENLRIEQKTSPQLAIKTIH